MFAKTALQTAVRTSARGMATRTPIVGGNWKCNAGNGITNGDVTALVDGLNALPAPKCEVYIAPPSLYLKDVKASAKSHFNVSAQNTWKLTKGAYTGEVSPEMLLDSNIEWTLIGHSERRDIFGEDYAPQLIRERGRWASDVALIYQRALARGHLSGSARVGDAVGLDLESLCAGWVQPATFR